MLLALVGADWGKAAQFGLDFEKKAFLGSPDRVSHITIVYTMLYHGSSVLTCFRTPTSR